MAQREAQRERWVRGMVPQEGSKKAGGAGLEEWLLDKLRCPACGRGGPEAGRTGVDLVCSSCGACYPVEEGVADLLPPGKRRLNLLQRSLGGTQSAAVYEHFRSSRLAAVLAGIPFATEEAMIVALLEPSANDEVLDVACGPGNFTLGIARAMNGGRIVALDIARPMLVRAKSNLRGVNAAVGFVRGDAQDLPFRGETFTKVNCCGGLHLFPDPDAALTEIARVLVPGGVFTGLSFVQGSGLLPRWMQGMGRTTLGVRFETLEQLAERLARAGMHLSQGEVAGWVAIFKANPVGPANSRKKDLEATR